jgi:hypothetical protein
LGPQERGADAAANLRFAWELHHAQQYNPVCLQYPGQVTARGLHGVAADVLSHTTSMPQVHAHTHPTAPVSPADIPARQHVVMVARSTSNVQARTTLAHHSAHTTHSPWTAGCCTQGAPTTPTSQHPRHTTLQGSMNTQHPPASQHTPMLQQQQQRTFHSKSCHTCQIWLRLPGCTYNQRCPAHQQLPGAVKLTAAQLHLPARTPCHLTSMGMLTDLFPPQHTHFCLPPS